MTDELLEFASTASSNAVVAKLSIDSVVCVNPNSRLIILLADITWSKNELFMSLKRPC